MDQSWKRWPDYVLGDLEAQVKRGGNRRRNQHENQPVQSEYARESQNSRKRKGRKSEYGWQFG